MDNLKTRLQKLSKGHASKEDLLFLKDYFNQRNIHEFDQLLQTDFNSEDFVGKSQKDYKEEVWGKLVETINQETKTTYSLSWFKLVAAVFLFIISSVVLFKTFLPTQSIQEQALIIISNNEENPKPIELPDGSTIELQQNARIEFSKDFISKKREVLLEGEAFFDVAKYEQLPFLVKTKEFTVHVLGTEFIVNTNTKDSLATVSLLEGKVELTKNNDNVYSEVLKPGEEISFNKNSNQFQPKRQVNLAEFEGLNSLKQLTNANYVEVSKELEQWFNINIDIPENFTSESIIKYQVDLRKQNLHEILDEIDQITDYKIIKINDKEYKLVQD